MNFMMRLIEESIINISREYACEGVHDALADMRPSNKETIDKLRAKFFIMLNQDQQMRKKLSEDSGKSSIVKHVCKFKASVFYKALKTRVIPDFAQDESMSLETFIDNLRDCYLCS